MILFYFLSVLLKNQIIVSVLSFAAVDSSGPRQAVRLWTCVDPLLLLKTASCQQEPGEVVCSAHHSMDMFHWHLAGGQQ